MVGTDGATIPVEISIKNLSLEQRLNVIEVLPSNFTIIAALDSGIISGPTITWNFLIQQDSSVYLNSIIKLPNETITDTTSAEISYLSGGIYIPYDTLYLEISTVLRKSEKDVGQGFSLADLFDEVIKEMHHLSNVILPLSEGEESLWTDSTRAVILSLLNEAKNFLMLNRTKALENLLTAAQKLSLFSVPSVSKDSVPSVLRKKLDFLIKLLYNNLEK